MYRKTERFLLILLLCSCTKGEKKEYRLEKISRQDGQRAPVALCSNCEEPLPTYPWDEQFVGKHPRITKEFFRCRGSRLNPPRTVERAEGKEVHVDCEGGLCHSLPMRDHREEIYPILLDLLNYVQEKSGRRVVITCGHRCPKHNTYADASNFNATSKHQIGAEVDFYLEGLEQEPNRVVEWIQEYYRDQPSFGPFQRYEKSDTNVSTPPWFNQEVFIKLFKADEGRDSDNVHPYPYICIQVRRDRDRNCRVTYSWDAAFNGYKR